MKSNVPNHIVSFVIKWGWKLQWMIFCKQPKLIRGDRNLNRSLQNILHRNKKQWVLQYLSFWTLYFEDIDYEEHPLECSQVTILKVNALMMHQNTLISVMMLCNFMGILTAKCKIILEVYTWCYGLMTLSFTYKGMASRSTSLLIRKIFKNWHI